MAITPSAEAQSLYVDPTPAYQPAIDYINKQVGAANTRYATNQADIKSIFGTLTTVRAQDRQKIQDQFTQSIADQQMSLANRTAEARAGVAAGTQQLAVTAGERGQGPMPTSTPVQQAAEEGIARSNEYQQTWEALQNVMSQQAQNDVTAAVRGYDYQQASALEQLRNNLEQRLSGLEGQSVDVQGQLAGAKIAGQQGVAQANYGEIQQRKAQEAAIKQAQASAWGQAEAARIEAEAKALEPKNYSDDIYGWEQRSWDNNFDPNMIASDVSVAFDAIPPSSWASPSGPSTAQIFQSWKKLNPGDTALPFVQEYIQRTYG
jgi:hypothetical protein